jgi:deazaflavin-dependent oxidoreductase (nitroreductase family)
MSSIRKQFYSIVNPILRFLIIRFGLGTRGDQDVLRILRVRGRKSRNVYELPVRIARMNNQRYLMSMLGETQWVRNLRATGTAQLLAGKTSEQIRAKEIQGKEQADFLTWYCQHPTYIQRARYGLKADMEHLTPVEVECLARLYPVFRLEQESLTPSH